VQSVCTLSVPSQYLSVLIRSRVQGPCVTSKSTVSASALGLAIYAAAHALLEENLSLPRLPAGRDFLRGGSEGNSGSNLAHPGLPGLTKRATLRLTQKKVAG